METYKIAQRFKNSDFPFQILRQKIDKYVVHRHQYYSLFYVLSGGNLHEFDGKDEIIKAGDIVLMPPGKSHSFKGKIKDKAEFEIVNCSFVPTMLEGHEQLLKKTRGFMELMYLDPFRLGYKTLSLSGTVNVKIRIILDELLFECSKKPQKNEFVIKTLLTDLLVTLVRFFEKQNSGKLKEKDGLTKKANSLLKSIEYLDNHFKESITLDEISLEKTGITKEYYCSIFKKMTGKTFTEYIKHLRIEYAAKLLKSSQKSVAEICFESGFKDLSYFTRTFRAQKGIAPKYFRTVLLEHPKHRRE